MKKAQITSFMIIALVISLSFGIFIFLNQNIVESNSNIAKASAIPSSLDQATLKQYVESCIEREAIEPILHLASLGGSINNTRENYKLYQQQLYHYLCVPIPGFKSCAHTLLLREEMEYELIQATSEEIESCIDIKAFQNEGYNVTPGNFKLDIDILPEAIAFQLSYPLTLEKTDNRIQVDSYAKILPIPLGQLYSMAISIINEEIENEFFNKDEWMYNNNLSINIEKQRPYPDTTYSLTKTLPNKRNLTFNFALKGTETVSQIGSLPPTDYAFGCCISPSDNTCFKNGDQNKCTNNNFRLKENQACSCPAPKSIPTTLPTPNNCDTTYRFTTEDNSGPKRNHGESWCSYDSVLTTQTGIGGLAYVGSRSYKHSCLNGKEVIEPCRDYREEFCTESTSNNQLQATCKNNRWEDCFKCTTESCCSDTEIRDCSWDDTFATDLQCVPLVPPGFKHWEGNGNEVCNVATAFKECDGFSCPNAWVLDTLYTCNAMGDCGNSRNYQDTLTTDGYFITDPVLTPSSIISQNPGLNENPREIGKATLTTTTNRKQQQIIGDFPHPASTLSIMFSAGLNYLDYLVDLSLTDFINPFTPDPEIKVLDYAFCQNWQSPLGGQKCQSCTDDPIKPCTEYRCKSLGQLCQYELTFEGIPSCYPITQNDITPPTIEVDREYLNDPYTAVDDTLKIHTTTYPGITITPEIIPYDKVQFRINTSEPSRCQLNYIPKIDLIFFPSFWFGDPTFKTQHNISLRLPPGLAVPSKVYDSLNITSLTQIADILFDLENQYAIYQDRFRDDFAIYKRFTGIDPITIINPIISSALNILQPFVSQISFLKALATTILGELELSSYYIFISCTDRTGNTNEDEFFIHFVMNTTYKDTNPPILLGSTPNNESSISSSAQNVSFNLFVNEPSECKYSTTDTTYNNMPHQLSCPTSPYQLDPFDGGSYRCTTLLPFTQNSSLYHFRCKDNPPIVESYGIKLEQHTNFSVKNRAPSRYLNTSFNTITASGDFLQYPTIYADSASTQLDLHLDDPLTCRFSNSTKLYQEMTHEFQPCQTTNTLDIGLYKCPTTLPNKGNQTYNIACLRTVNKSRNTNPTSYTVNLTRAKILQNIIISPEQNAIISTPNPILAITLAKPISKSNIICGYNTKLNEGFFPMTKASDFHFEQQLSDLDEGFHTFHVQCTDSANNILKISTTFRIEVTF